MAVNELVIFGLHIISADFAPRESFQNIEPEEIGATLSVIYRMGTTGTKAERKKAIDVHTLITEILKLPDERRLKDFESEYQDAKRKLTVPLLLTLSANRADVLREEEQSATLLLSLLMLPDVELERLQRFSPTG